MGRIRHHPTPPAAPDPWTPSARASLPAREVWSVVGREAPRLAWRAPRWVLRRRPARSAVVVTLPGFGAGERTMAPIGRWLRLHGHTVVPWGLGVNRGDPEGDGERMKPRVQALAAQHGQPVVLLGWSLGGVIAREVARELPDAVERVVTYGTPTIGGPTYTAAAGFWGPDECARIAALTATRDDEQPIRSPITAVFTRADRVVSWPACIDRRSPQVHHVEVSSTHTGLGFDPDVWEVVADAVAEAG